MYGGWTHREINSGHSCSGRALPWRERLTARKDNFNLGRIRQRPQRAQAPSGPPGLPRKQ